MTVNKSNLVDKNDCLRVEQMQKLELKKSGCQAYKHAWSGVVLYLFVRHRFLSDQLFNLNVVRIGPNKLFDQFHILV